MGRSDGNELQRNSGKIFYWVGIDNSYNAAMLAVQILALKYPEIREKLIKFRKEMKEKFIKENEEKVEF